MKTVRIIGFVVAFLFSANLGLLTFSAESCHGQTAAKKAAYSPYAGREFPINVYWGDTHLHTNYSSDSAAFGNMLGLEEAYRFARGEEVTSTTGQRVKLSRPLDFLVVADHAENIGAIRELIRGNPDLLKDSRLKHWHEIITEGGESKAKAVWEAFVYMVRSPSLSTGQAPKTVTGPKLLKSIWQKYTAVADRYNDPGRFTAFVGYEYTSTPGGNNLHRNVIFEDGADKANQTLPFSAFDSKNPEDLWNALQAYEKKTGGRVFAIPHNSNLSNGLMFGLVDFLGHPLTRAYAEKRSRWEPLVEITQTKGTSEAHPVLSPNDEFANYEIWDRSNSVSVLSEAKKPEMLSHEYVRSALKLGLKLEERLGVNPYKFGMVGGTDIHNSLSTTEEDNFFGIGAAIRDRRGRMHIEEPSAQRWNRAIQQENGLKVMGWEQSASGYTAVWAKENTRKAIFEAMTRKEVYATTGTRMVVRFFGGWNFEPGDAQTPMLARVGYEKGTPMGGDLRSAPKGKAPTFLVAALKDPIGANLDRIQIVKGWLDARGDLEEKVYDVVWSGRRKPDREGKLPPVGNTVDVKNATWTNTIGDPELITVWKDPDFDPKLRAFYYARVIEIPTPRWTAYDAKFYGVQMDKEVPMILQERAFASPIWYSPRK